MRSTVVKPAGRALLVAVAMCSFLAAASTPLFGQTLLAVEGNLPTPALPPGALPAASSTESKAPAEQLPTASGGSPEVVARPPVPSPPPTTEILGASPRAAAAPLGSSRPAAAGALGTSPQAVAASEMAQATKPSAVSSPSGPNIVPDEVGGASWYGSRFHGRLTASGQVYDMNAMTAAHRTLPFGTKVRVTDLENGKSVVVMVNDRGPFVGGRIIDLSRAAAEAIGLTGQGVTRVRLHVIELGNGRRVPEMGPARAGNGASAPAAIAAARPAGTTGSSGSTTPVVGTTATASISAATSPTLSATAAPSAPSSGAGGQPAVPSVVVQVGAFRDLTNAVRLKDLLSQNGFDPIYEKWESYTRVVLLPVPQSELAALRQRLEKIGITSILVRHN